jgi:hypothetical protein
MTRVDEPSSKTIIIGGKQLTFDQEVSVVIELEDRSIILLSTSDFLRGDPLVARNVLCFDKNGDLLWRIEDAEMMIGEGEDEVPQSYLSMTLREDGRIRVGNPDAIFYVNPDDGSIYDGEPKYM